MFLQFAQMDEWASELGICPYTGQWEQIKNNMRWLPKTYAIFVILYSLEQYLSLYNFPDDILVLFWG